MNASEIVNTFVNVRRSMIDAGYCQDRVNQAVQNAALRARDAGLGKVQQTRRLQRDLYPGLAPRPVAAGDRCVTLPNYPGQENAYQAEVARYAAQGFTVTTVSPFSKSEVTYACPPGELPRENQVLF